MSVFEAATWVWVAVLVAGALAAVGAVVWGVWRLVRVVT